MPVILEYSVNHAKFAHFIRMFMTRGHGGLGLLSYALMYRFSAVLDSSQCVADIAYHLAFTQPTNANTKSQIAPSHVEAIQY